MAPAVGEGASPLLVVVGRDLQQLYDYLAARFAEIPDIQVVLDRRAVASASERAAARDRRRLGSDEQVRSRGYMITRRRGRGVTA